jgi:DNA-binding response OmpR family regulator
MSQGEPAMPARILFLDDEPDLVDALVDYFQGLGHAAQGFSDAITFEADLRAHGADLVILDMTMPGRSGLDLMAEVEALRGVPVIILSALSDPLDRVIGLESGADDYVVKPVDPRELAARAAAVLARRTGHPRALVPFETASVDLSAARVLLQDGATEPLSAGEVALIRAFASRPHHLLTRETLIDLAPGDSHDALDKSVDARVARLRRKLRTDRIVTVRGQGYRYEPPWRE